jgi:hypothetical protein
MFLKSRVAYGEYRTWRERDDLVRGGSLRRSGRTGARYGAPDADDDYAGTGAFAIN